MSERHVWEKSRTVQVIDGYTGQPFGYEFDDYYALYDAFTGKAIQAADVAAVQCARYGSIDTSGESVVCETKKDGGSLSQDADDTNRYTRYFSGGGILLFTVGGDGMDYPNTTKPVLAAYELNQGTNLSVYTSKAVIQRRQAPFV